MKKNLIAASIFGLTLFLPQAEAALFDFSYTFGENNIAGILDGTLQGDNNTVAVTSIQSFAFNGTPGSSLPVPTVYNADNFFSVLYPQFYPILPGFPDETTPWLTLDGSYMNFLACPVGDCNNGFAFIVGDSLATATGGSAYIAGASWGFTHETFNQADWHMSAVPLPAAVWMFGASLLGWLKTQKRKMAA